MGLFISTTDWGYEAKKVWFALTGLKFLVGNNQNGLGNKKVNYKTPQSLVMNRLHNIPRQRAWVLTVAYKIGSTYWAHSPVPYSQEARTTWRHYATHKRQH